MVNSPFYIADATKSIPLSQVTPEMAQGWWGGQRDAAAISAGDAWRLLPVVYRAIDIRAKSVSRAPYVLQRGNGTVVDEQDAAPVLTQLRSLLYLNEAALCLYGSAYWVIERNVFGRNATPRWLLPPTMQPQYLAGDVVSYKRMLSTGERIDLKKEDVVAWWEPNLLTEIGPGVPVIQRALAAAGALHHLNIYVANFFGRGAIKAYALRVDGNPNPIDRERIKSAWRRLLAGVRAAFSVEVFSKGVEFQALGDSLRETVNPQLTNQAREDVLQALGVPLSLVMSNAANYATAQQDAANFYDLTIEPQVEALHLPPLNLYLAKQGYRLDVDWKRLEVRQAQQLAQAQAVNQLVGGPILTVDEGRAIIGYDPMTPAPAPPPAPSGAPGEDMTAGLADLKKWQAKALKRLKESGSADCDFTSSTVPPARAAAIRRRLATATTIEAVKAAFAVDGARLTSGDVDGLFDQAAKRAADLLAEIANA